MRPLRGQWLVGFALALLIVGVSCSKNEASQEQSAKPSPDRAEAKPAKERTTSASPTIVFLGDSLTAGRGLAEKDAFPALIEDKLEAAGSDYRVINAGRSGDTTASGLSRVDWYLQERVNPRVLVIFLGSNDAMRGVAIETMEQNLRGIIDKARAFRPGLEIFLVELRTFPNMGKDYGQEFQVLFARVAEAEKVRLIEFPLVGVAGDRQLNQGDGIHPNREGTRVVADVMWQALAGHVGVGEAPPGR